MSIEGMSLKEVADLVKAIGQEVSIVVEGQPGIGKTFMHKQLCRELNVQPLIIDCAMSTDGGDVQMPMYTTTDDGVKEFVNVPNASFGIGSDQPVGLLLDEVGKSTKMFMNAILPVIQERQIGNSKLPEGSFVFATTNNASDGVGDNFPAHARNRVCVVQMRNPTSEEWLQDFALLNNVAPEICAFVHQYPQVFDHYSQHKDYKVNQYIFDPRDTGRKAFVTGRSLAKASTIVQNKNQFSANALRCALEGTIGKAAAADMATMLDISGKLETWENIKKNPLTAKCPDRGPAQIIASLQLISRGAQGNDAERGAVAVYLQRMDMEVQALACTMAFGTGQNGKWLSCREMTQMASKVGRVLV